MTMAWVILAWTFIGLFWVERGLESRPEYAERRDFPIFMLGVIALWPLLLIVVLFRHLRLKK